MSKKNQPSMCDADDAVEKWVRPEIRSLKVYHVPEAGGLIKLDAMENPYTWPETLVDEWLELLRDISFNRYPDSMAKKLKVRLRNNFDIPEHQEILLGNGSDELIQMIALAISGPDRVLMAPQPSFSMFAMIATCVGLKFVGVPLNAEDFSLDSTAMLAAIEKHQPAAIFLDYPNNPSGLLFDEASILAILEAAPGLVVIDEAYHAFAQKTYINKLDQYSNLLVLRTLSKMGLAGLRLGMLAGNPAWLKQINKVRLPYNISVLTQVSAEFALSHRQVFEEQTQKICQDRDYVFKEMQQMAEITVYPSSANFILFRVPEGRGSEIFESLKAKDVLIKNLQGKNQVLNDCLRVTVGRPEENRAFLTALSATL